jgi:hypothetical protein
MEVIKLQNNKYGLGTKLQGKLLIFSIEGKLLDFPSRKEAEQMKDKIQRSYTDKKNE